MADIKWIRVFKKLEEVQFLFDVVKAKDRYQRRNSKVRLVFS